MPGVTPEWSKVAGIQPVVRWHVITSYSIHYTKLYDLGLLAAGSVTDEQWGGTTRSVDFFDLKADVEALLAPLQAQFEAAEHPALHPGRTASIRLDGQLRGYIGELHPKWVQKYELGTAPIVCELDVEAVLAASLPEYSVISRLPSVTRDMALVIDQGVTAAQLLCALKAAAHPIVKDIQLFDVYQGKGVVV